MSGTWLVTRLDSDGDVLLSGPALRAVAAQADRLVLLCGPRGEAAARLLPGVDEVMVWQCPWIDPDPGPVDPGEVADLVERLRRLQVGRALVLSSYHQSPLPTALVLRLAGVPWVGATSEDYPGSLLDLRHQLPATGLHEVERMLSLVAAAGCPSDDPSLQVSRPLPPTRHLSGSGPYVVVHPGASVPSRAPSPAWAHRLVGALEQAGHRVVVTGSPGEAALTSSVAAGTGALDLGGRTTLAELAGVLDGAACAVVGNTGPAHLASAVGTPVVSLFSPVVPSERWRPWAVPSVVLGDQAAGCAGTRARRCPLPRHRCLDDVPVAAAVAAVERLLDGAPCAAPLPVRVSA